MSRLLLITGATRRRSTNTSAVHTARALLGDESAAIYDGLEHLPLYDRAQNGSKPPAEVAELRGAIAAADAVVFCTPEYSGRLPERLRNLLDWTVAGGDLRRKPASWINAVGPGASDGIDSALRSALLRAGAAVMTCSGACVPVAHGFIDPEGLIDDPMTRARLGRVLGAIVSELGTVLAGRRAAGGAL
jgi:chromate reductase, NAD(P)H dehydrogenase (quinone)